MTSTIGAALTCVTHVANQGTSRRPEKYNKHGKTYEACHPT